VLVAAGPLVLAEGGGGGILVRWRWLREEENRGAVEDVLVVAVGGVDEVVLGEVLLHVPVPVAPLGGPGVHAGHAVAAERVETGREISEVEARSSRVGGAGGQGGRRGGRGSTPRPPSSPAWAWAWAPSRQRCARGSPTFLVFRLVGMTKRTPLL